MPGWLTRLYIRWCPWRRGPLRQVQVTVYSRPGCHLCDVAWDQLRKFQAEYGFALAKQNIEHDPALLEQLGEQIPVVAINHRIRFRGKVNEILLRRLLRAELFHLHHSRS